MSQDQVVHLIEDAERDWLQQWMRGPTRIAPETPPPQVGATAPDLTLPDQTDRPVTLSPLWRDGPLLLLFWRGFGCGCGRERATRLRDELSSYRDVGATVVAIGQGEPERADAYARDHGL